MNLFNVNLQSIGLMITIKVIPPSSLKSAKSNGKVDLFRASWVADYPDAQNYLSLFYSPNFAPNGPNYTHFKEEQFDRWYEQAMLETDKASRINLYKENGFYRGRKGASSCVVL